MSNNGFDKAVVCYSGGHSSAIVAVEAVRKYGKDNVILLNHDISSRIEHEDIKRFKKEVAQALEVPITYANAANFEEMTPLEVMKAKGGNSFGLIHCTMYLKTQPFHEWLKKNYPANRKSPCKDIVILYGFDAEEEERIARRSEMLKALGYETDFPLANWDRTIKEIEEIGVRRPTTYKLFKHANCVGCLKAGRQHWYCVFCLRPDVWEAAKQAESQTGYSIIKGIFLHELEPQFTEMRDQKGICPTDRGNSAAFWANVSKILPEQTSFFPCDCAI